MRRALAAAVAAAVLAATVWASPSARAEDAAGADSRLVLRALDQSAMLETMRTPDDVPAEVPLGGRRVHVLVLRREGEKPPAATIATTATTDDAGKFEVPLTGLVPGDRISFRIDPDAAGRPLYASVGLDPFETSRPAVAKFHRVAREGSPLFFDRLFLTVRRMAPNAEAEPYVRIWVIAEVSNRSPEIWMGADGRPALELPLPAGFEPITVHWNESDHRDFRPGTTHGGRPALHVGGFFLPSIEGPERVRAVMTGPWHEDLFDAAFHTEAPVRHFQLNLEEGVFTYDEPGEDQVALADAGVNQPVNGVVTHGWAASDIPAHATIGAGFFGGRRIHRRVWLVVGAIALAFAGASLLALSLRGRRAADVSPRKPARDAPPADAAARLRDLERRRDRGEITTFEYAARKAQIEGHAPRRAVPAPEPPAPAADEPSAILREIESRAGRADAAQLRRDVATLADLLRRHLRG